MAKHAILKSFYASKEWINLRALIIHQRMIEHHEIRCEKCGEVITRSIDIIGHHKIELTPENVNDRNISLNPKNIELICYDCHNKEHFRFGAKKERKVYIVYGPPLAGKKTFVKHDMHRGDLVIDMDRLYEAVSMLPSFDKPDNLFSNVMGIHNLLIDNIKTRFGKWNNVYIIGGYADKYKREKMANDLGAELIFYDTSKDECLARLSIDEERMYRQDEWEGYIDKWFMSYSE